MQNERTSLTPQSRIWNHESSTIQQYPFEDNRSSAKEIKQLADSMIQCFLPRPKAGNPATGSSGPEEDEEEKGQTEDEDEQYAPGGEQELEPDDEQELPPLEISDFLRLVSELLSLIPQIPLVEASTYHRPPGPPPPGAGAVLATTPGQNQVPAIIQAIPAALATAAQTVKNLYSVNQSAASIFIRALHFLTTFMATSTTLPSFFQIDSTVDSVLALLQAIEKNDMEAFLPLQATALSVLSAITHSEASSPVPKPAETEAPDPVAPEEIAPELFQQELKQYKRSFSNSIYSFLILGFNNNYDAANQELFHLRLKLLALLLDPSLLFTDLSQIIWTHFNIYDASMLTTLLEATDGAQNRSQVLRMLGVSPNEISTFVVPIIQETPTYLPHKKGSPLYLSLSSTEEMGDSKNALMPLLAGMFQMLNDMHLLHSLKQTLHIMFLLHPGVSDAVASTSWEGSNLVVINLYAGMLQSPMNVPRLIGLITHELGVHTLDHFRFTDEDFDAEENDLMEKGRADLPYMDKDVKDQQADHVRVGRYWFDPVQCTTPARAQMYFDLMVSALNAVKVDYCREIFATCCVDIARMAYFNDNSALCQKHPFKFSRAAFTVRDILLARLYTDPNMKKEKIAFCNFNIWDAKGYAEDLTRFIEACKIPEAPQTTGHPS